MDPLVNELRELGKPLSVLTRSPFLIMLPGGVVIRHKGRHFAVEIIVGESISEIGYFSIAMTKLRQ